MLSSCCSLRITSTQLIKRVGVRSCLIRCLSTANDDASAVVIGAGVIGSSVAYHLSEMGLKNVVMLERGTVGGGITFHSPGLVCSAHPAHRYKPILADSVELYTHLEEETGVKIDFKTPGTLRLARSAQRVDEFRMYASKDYYRTGDVCRTSFVEADRIKELCPLLNVDEVLAGLYTEGDGYLNAAALANALATGAKNRGSRIIDNCTIENIVLRSDGYWDVQTNQGTIKAFHVVNAAGLRARDIGLLNGIDLAVVHLEHQYAVIGPVDSVSNLGQELPAIIDHDSTFYVRHYGDKLLFGAFERAELVSLLKEWSTKRVPDNVTLEPQFDRLKEPYAKACELVNGLANAEVKPGAAAFCMTTDSYPLVGPQVGLPNYWIAAGFIDGIGSAGGMGKYLANWMMNGEPPFELFETEPNRFGRWANKKFLLEKAKESYSYMYNWGLPSHARMAGRPTSRVSGIYGALKLEGANMYFRTGWEIPSYFPIDDEDPISALTREYQMVANKCGLLDLSHKGKIEVSGPDSTTFIDYLLTKRAPGYSEVTHHLMLSRSGRILSTFKALHHDYIKSEYILLTVPEHEIRDIRWMEKIIAEKKFNVQVDLVSEYLASLAVIGPTSRNVLAELTKTDLSEESFPNNTVKPIRIHGIPCICSRHSATGELSWELFHNRADSLKLYEALMHTGKQHGMINFGMLTLNTMRMEKGFKLWGTEITLDANPFEAGLEPLLDMTKEDFVGKLALTEMLKTPQKRRLALLTLDTAADANPNVYPTGCEVVRRKDGEEMIGQVSSGCYSVKLHKPLCFAFLSNEVSDSETLTVDMGGIERVTATVLEKPPSLPEHL